MGNMQGNHPPEIAPEEVDPRQLLDQRVGHGVRHVLVVDDEPDILGSFKTFVEGCLSGVKVLTATSAEEALEILDVADPALVVSDLRMPGMDGLAFLTEVAQRRPKTSRILMTAYPDLDAVMDAKNMADVDRFLTKPVEPMDVVSLVYDLLHERYREIEREAAFERALELLGEKRSRGKA